MGNIAAKKKISWTVKTDRNGDVTILSDNRFKLPAISDSENPDISNFIATNGTYIYLFPVTGRGQLYIEHSYMGEYDMPMELLDYLRV